jgi:hypothetical protein
MKTFSREVSQSHVGLTQVSRPEASQVSRSHTLFRCETVRLTPKTMRVKVIITTIRVDVETTTPTRPAAPARRASRIS